MFTKLCTLLKPSTGWFWERIASIYHGLRNPPLGKWYFVGSTIRRSHGRHLKRGKGYLLTAIPPLKCVTLLYFHKPSPWSPLEKKSSQIRNWWKSTCHWFHTCMQGMGRRSYLSPSSTDTAEKIKFAGFLCLHMVSLTMRMYKETIFIQEQLPETVKHS